MTSEIITALIAGLFAFAGATLAQFASRKRVAAETEKFLAEAEKIRVEAKGQADAQVEKLRAEAEKLKAEAEIIRWQSEQAASERATDRKALSDALTRIEEMEIQRRAQQREERQRLPRFYGGVATGLRRVST